MSTSSTVHVANEQIFTQMDLSNSLIQTGDGSINIDANGLANLLAIQQQHLLSAKPGYVLLFKNRKDITNTYNLVEKKHSGTKTR